MGDWCLLLYDKAVTFWFLICLGNSFFDNSVIQSENYSLSMFVVYIWCNTCVNLATANLECMHIMQISFVFYHWAKPFFIFSLFIIYLLLDFTSADKILPQDKQPSCPRNWFGKINFERSGSWTTRSKVLSCWLIFYQYALASVYLT
jgi:tellurite resistance protein TehA-like permease